MMCSAAPAGATWWVPVMLAPNAKPVKRNFVRLSDLVDAILLALDHPKARQQTFNICMDEPVDYRQAADDLHETRKLPSVQVKTPYHSAWMDNTKARFLLDWRPQFDLKRLIEQAWRYRRESSDPRVVWYPG
jgi:UDP-glucose 4-epimerase